MPCFTSGKYDAFESTLEVLRAMRDYPDANPADYATLDASFRAFMECADLGGGCTHAIRMAAMQGPGASAG
eukprot:363632-Chlamydomonas_euryale.AAC.7